MNKLFQDFDTISEKEWKNKVQVELKGLEYNETLVWGTKDQINVKPLYTKDDVDYLIAAIAHLIPSTAADIIPPA